MMLSMYRWMTIKGSVDENEITLNGFLFRNRFPTSQMVEEKHVESRLFHNAMLSAGCGKKQSISNCLTTKVNELAACPKCCWRVPIGKALGNICNPYAKKRSIEMSDEVMEQKSSLQRLQNITTVANGYNIFPSASCQSGGHGTRTRNRLPGTSFPMKPLAIRLPSIWETTAPHLTVKFGQKSLSELPKILTNRA